MNCERFSRKLSAYFDHELADPKALELHSKECKECREELSGFAEAEVRLKKLPLESVSSDFYEQFWRKAENSQETDAVGLWDRFIMRWTPVPTLAALVIILFLTFSVISPALYGISDDQTRKDTASLAMSILFASPSQNIFGPLNFSRYCSGCLKMTCEHCTKCACSKKGVSQ